MCPLQMSEGATTAEENRIRQLIAGELQTNFQSGNRLQGHRQTCADSSATTSARFYQLQRVSVCLLEGAFYRECIVGDSGWCIHSCRQQGSHSADRSRPVCSVQHSRPQDSARVPADRFGVKGIQLTWLWSYLNVQTLYMEIGQHQSTAIQLKVSVHQGSVLGPILFAVYASPVAGIIASHGFQYHMLMTRSFALRCVPTTHLPDCPF